ncbi:hypothetical protein L3X38_029480 [Prunus dulcis]|uniref:Disease resistance protein CC-NBS-LRR class family n=1 Tax=Prunus dulcis TaxID=3755 RepID=A0AAD4Z311_PRUDU|nr:hypothetical protein L3X38_029480 [Prunus dulcis]
MSQISSLKFWMANLAKLEFAALDLSGDNYLSWVLDAKFHLRANGLGQTIVDENDVSPEENAKAMIFLRRHIHEALKNEYVVVDEPLVLWKALGERYDHQRMVTLPKARYEWTHLRFQDFKHSGFKKYSELVSCLLLAEQNNELLLKNHQSRPTGSSLLPEINAASQEVNATSSRGSIHKRGRGGKRGRWKVEINYIDHAPPATDGSLEISHQLNKTHLDVSDFVTERGNEAYESELE